MTLLCNRCSLRLKPLQLRQRQSALCLLSESNQQFFESAVMRCSGQKHSSSVIRGNDLADPPCLRNKDNSFLAAVEVNPELILCNGVETMIAAP